MAITITGNSQLANTKNDLIVSLVQKELRFQAKLLPYFTDYSAFAGKGLKSIQVPRFSSFTVQDRPTGIDGDVLALTAAKDIINIDKRFYVSWIVDSMDELESSVEVQSLMLQRGATAHARAIDSALIANLRSVSVDLGNVPVTYAQLLDMVTYLKKADANISDAAFIVSPEQVKVLMGLNEFKSSEFYGSNPIATGQVGRIMGIPVVEHNGLVDGELYLAERGAIGYAFQQAPNVAVQSKIEYGTTATLTAVDQKFGSAGLQIAEKSAPAGKTPLSVGIFV